MEFGLSDDQRLLQEQVAKFLDDAAGLDQVRAAATDGNDQMRTAFAAMGLAGIMVPEAQGGAGLCLLDAALVQELLGRNAAPLPFMAEAVLAVQAIRDAGTPAQQAEWLPRIASGDVRIAAALSEAAAARETAGVRLQDGRLSGKALFALEAEGASHVLTTTADGAIVLAETGLAGVTRMRSIDRTTGLSEIMFDGAAAEQLSGSNDARAAQARLVATARTLIAADTLGAAGSMIEKAVAYAMEREQFGRVIGSFQAVKHLCAEMAARLEPCRSLVWYAAHSASAEPGEFPLMAALAKAHLAETGTFVARTATEVHGGMGFTDLLGLHYWFKRIGQNRQLFGGPEITRADAARMQGFGS